jgi:hypothetical protein
LIWINTTAVQWTRAELPRFDCGRMNPRHRSPISFNEACGPVLICVKAQAGNKADGLTNAAGWTLRAAVGRSPVSIWIIKV